MRWKLILLAFFMIVLAVGAGIGWFKWNERQTRKQIVEQLSVCKNQIRMGQHDKAQAALERVLTAHPDLEEADAAWALLANSYEETGDDAKAARCWDKIRQDYPGSPHADEALAALADYHFELGEVEQAEQLWDLLLENFPESDARDQALFGKARLVYKRKGPEAAREPLMKILEEYPNSKERPEIEKMLGDINVNLLMSPALNEGSGDQIYTIKRGDALATIGRRFNVSPDLLSRINHIQDERSLTVGKRIKIPSTDFSIVVDKSDNTLLLKNHGEFFKRYPVRTGRQDWQTPRGEYHILRKVKNPTWNNPQDHQTYGPGDPENELGTRWMAFEGSMLGIHGTIKPETIGTYASNGCVGMLKEDVEELFDLVPVRTPVKIVGKMEKSDQQQAN